MTKNIPDGATHTNGKSFYLYEELCDGEKGEWYRFNSGLSCWVEILNKPRNIQKIDVRD